MDELQLFIEKRKKVKHLKIVTLLTLLFAASVAQGADWHKLKHLEAYSGVDNKLGGNVDYMEIRFYKSAKSNYPYKTLQLYKKPLSSYSQETIDKFKALPQRHSNKDSYLRFRNNGNIFFIDNKGKMFWSDERKDLKEILGNIDTPAELALSLWLNYENGWQSYKKTFNGYKIKTITPTTKCIVYTTIGSVDKNGNYNTGDDIKQIIRKKCKKRNNTKFISNKKIDYESYRRIEMDNRGNLYLLGSIKKNKTHQSDYYSVLDKYNNSGKLLWSKNLNGNPYIIQVAHNSVYVIDNNKIKAKYTLNGKKVSFKRGEIVIKKSKRKGLKHALKVLPSEKKNIELSISDHVVDKKDNIYAAGLEIFYPNGVPDGSGMCGNNGEVDGALVAKLNSRGKLIWARVIDRDN